MTILLRVALLGVLVLVPSLVGDFQVYLLTLALLWAVLALSMGLLMGYVGEINFGHAAFVGIAAYASALLRLRIGWSFWAAAPVALVVVGIVAFLVGLPTFRLKGPFFALVMLGFGEIVRLVLSNWQDMTNGPLGLRPVASPDPILGHGFDTKRSFYYLVLGVLVAGTVAVTALVRSKTGRMFVAIREDAALAEFLGIPIMRYKLIGLVISAVLAGCAGTLIGPFLTVLSPGQFTVFAAVDMIVMVIVGGAGTVAGPLLGALFLIYVPETLHFAQTLRPIAFGLLLIVLVIFMPGGIMGAVVPLLRRSRAMAAART